MEVAGNGQRAYAQSTRVYAPTRGANAYAYAEALPKREPEARPAPKPRPRPQPRAKEQKHLSAACRFALVFTIAAVAVAMLFVMYRYSLIAGEYQKVNTLKEQITESQLRVNALNVKLQCAVSIDDAQAAAKRLGMTYPTASQFVRAGDALPGGGAPADAETSPGTDGGAEPAPDTGGEEAPSEGA